MSSSTKILVGLASGAFVGLLCGMGAVAAVNFGAPSVSFLWHNVIGAVTVVLIGTLLSLGAPPSVRGGTVRSSR